VSIKLFIDPDEPNEYDLVSKKIRDRWFFWGMIEVITLLIGLVASFEFKLSVLFQGDIFITCFIVSAVICNISYKGPDEIIR
jgi:hypothetical protein